MKYMLLFSLPQFIMDQFQEHKALLIFIALGMIAGLVAQLVLPGRGFGILGTIGIGIAGLWLGSHFLMPHMEFIEDHLFRKLASAIVAAMVISVIINLIRGGEDKDLTHWRDR